MDAIGSNRTPETPGRSRVEIVDHGPALLRIYLMVGWAALAILSVVSGLVYRRMAVGALTYDTEGRAAAITQQFIATLAR